MPSLRAVTPTADFKQSISASFDESVCCSPNLVGRRSPRHVHGGCGSDRTQGVLLPSGLLTILTAPCSSISELVTASDGPGARFTDAVLSLGRANCEFVLNGERPWT